MESQKEQEESSEDRGLRENRRSSRDLSLDENRRSSRDLSLVENRGSSRDLSLRQNNRFRRRSAGMADGLIDEFHGLSPWFVAPPALRKPDTLPRRRSLGTEPVRPFKSLAEAVELEALVVAPPLMPKSDERYAPPRRRSVGNELNTWLVSAPRRDSIDSGTLRRDSIESGHFPLAATLLGGPVLPHPGTLAPLIRRRRSSGGALERSAQTATLITYAAVPSWGIGAVVHLALSKVGLSRIRNKLELFAKNLKDMDPNSKTIVDQMKMNDWNHFELQCVSHLSSLEQRWIDVETAEARALRPLAGPLPTQLPPQNVAATKSVVKPPGAENDDEALMRRHVELLEAELARVERKIKDSDYRRLSAELRLRVLNTTPKHRSAVATQTFPEFTAALEAR